MAGSAGAGDPVAAAIADLVEPHSAPFGRRMLVLDLVESQRLPRTHGLLHRCHRLHGQLDEVRDDLISSSLLVYDGPQWIGVYERSEPPQVRDTPRGSAEVWVVRE